MYRSRFVMLLAAPLLVAGAVGGTVGVDWYYRLPAPRDADDEQLMRWLVTRDVQAEQADVQQSLVRRLERFLDENGDEVSLNSIDGELTSEQSEQLWANIVTLLELWFFERVEQYHELSVSERTAYIDSNLKKLNEWGIANLLDAASGNRDQQAAGATSPLQSAKKLLDQLQPWIDGQESGQQERTREFLQAVQLRWIAM